MGWAGRAGDEGGLAPTILSGMDRAFAKDLARWGPDAPPYTIDAAAANTYCRRFTLAHSENFSVATLFLPRRLLRHFYAVYAFCRWADNLGDETGGGARALELHLRAGSANELNRCYAGRPLHPVMVRALSGDGQRLRHPCPAVPRLALRLRARTQPRQAAYTSYDQLLDYCQHSASFGSVGCCSTCFQMSRPDAGSPVG